MNERRKERKVRSSEGWRERRKVAAGRKEVQGVKDAGRCLQGKE